MDTWTRSCLVGEKVRVHVVQTLSVMVWWWCSPKRMSWVSCGTSCSYTPAHRPSYCCSCSASARPRKDRVYHVHVTCTACITCASRVLRWLLQSDWLVFWRLAGNLGSVALLQLTSFERLLWPLAANEYTTTVYTFSTQQHHRLKKNWRAWLKENGHLNRTSTSQLSL